MFVGLHFDALIGLVYFDWIALLWLAWRVNFVVFVVFDTCFSLALCDYDYAVGLNSRWVTLVLFVILLGTFVGHVASCLLKFADFFDLLDDCLLVCFAGYSFAGLVVVTLVWFVVVTYSLEGLQLVVFLIAFRFRLVLIGMFGQLLGLIGCLLPYFDVCVHTL